MKTFKKNMLKNSWIILLMIGIIGLFFTNYYVILLARIFLVLGITASLINGMNWVESSVQKFSRVHHNSYWH